VLLIQIGKPSLGALLVYTFSARAIMRIPLSPILVFNILLPYAGARIAFFMGMLWAYQWPASWRQIGYCWGGFSNRFIIIHFGYQTMKLSSLRKVELVEKPIGRTSRFLTWKPQRNQSQNLHEIPILSSRRLTESPPYWVTYRKDSISSRKMANLRSSREQILRFLGERHRCW